MFGSNDDKKPQPDAGEKKGLFGWWRKKSQEAAQPEAEQPAPEELAVPEADAAVEPAAAPVDPVVEPVPTEIQPEPIAELAPTPVVEPEAAPEQEPEPAVLAADKVGFFARLKQGLSKTSSSLGE